MGNYRPPLFRKTGSASANQRDNRISKHLTRIYIMIQKLLATLLFLGTLATTAGCNTVEGIGKDIERGGEATQDTARDIRRKM
jgi:entericidin B